MMMMMMMMMMMVMVTLLGIIESLLTLPRLSQNKLKYTETAYLLTVRTNTEDLSVVIKNANLRLISVKTKCTFAVPKQKAGKSCTTKQGNESFKKCGKFKIFGK
jgi:hypothetical protein